jgi:hypothetical protein
MLQMSSQSLDTRMLKAIARSKMIYKMIESIIDLYQKDQHTCYVIEEYLIQIHENNIILEQSTKMALVEIYKNISSPNKSDIIKLNLRIFLLDPIGFEIITDILNC